MTLPKSFHPQLVCQIVSKCFFQTPKGVFCTSPSLISPSPSSHLGGGGVLLVVKNEACLMKLLSDFFVLFISTVGQTVCSLYCTPIISQSDICFYVTGVCNTLIPLANRVQGLYCKLPTKFFPVDLCPNCAVEWELTVQTEKMSLVRYLINL